MSADKDFIQHAVVVVCMMTATCHGAFNASVTFTIHCTYLHFLKYTISIADGASFIRLFIFYFLMKIRSRNNPDGRAHTLPTAVWSAYIPLAF